jgi:proteasome lid subunit RPN8/RPN11
MPLVYAGTLGVGDPITERHERARKIKPQYAEGALVQVAGAQNQAEAEFIQGLLLEEGVPSLLQRTRGFDVPDMMAAGPRAVMVPESGAAAAREVLLEAEILGNEPSRAPDGPLRFEVDGREIIAAQDAFEAEGAELGAIYHSHTRSAPEPSQTDVNMARWWPDPLWVIVGVKDPAAPEVRAWRIVDDRVSEASLEIV